MSTKNATEPSKKRGGIYFRGLNALRFFAAAAVMITHIELLKKYFGYPSAWRLFKGEGSTLLNDVTNHGYSTWQIIVTKLGTMGVVFFFVLSGFLITYLLLVEKDRNKKINIKRFYWRRILRIWPLYFLILVLGFFILPHFHALDIPIQSASLQDNFLGNLICYLVILPNLAYSIYDVYVPHIGQSWSIGVEEQFYLIWPVIISFFIRSKRAIIVFICLLVALKATVLILDQTGRFDLAILSTFLSTIKMESMAIGAFGAIYLFEREELVKKIFNRRFIAIISLLLLLFIQFICPKRLAPALFLIESVLCLMIILAVCLRTSRESWLESKVFRTLGNISYGLYMYHFMVAAIVVYLYSKINLPHSGADGYSSILENGLIYLFSFALSIAVSFLSYTYFESYFIHKKKKHTVIQSGEEARKP